MPSRDLERLMWGEACALLDRAERLHRQFYRPAPPSRTPNWEPPVDLYRGPQGVWLVIALPGVEDASIEIRLAGNELRVRAERRLPATLHEAAMERLEIPFGRFERQLLLPAGRYVLAQREWRDGCLHLDLRHA